MTTSVGPKWWLMKAVCRQHTEKLATHPSLKGVMVHTRGSIPLFMDVAMTQIWPQPLWALSILGEQEKTAHMGMP